MDLAVATVEWGRSPERLARALALPPETLTALPLWAEAFTEPDPGLEAGLEPEGLRSAGREASLSDAMRDAVAAVAAGVSADPALAAFFRYCRHRVLHDTSMVLSWEEPWPALDACMGGKAGLLNVLVMLSAMPQQREVYRRLGIPEDVGRETLADLRLWMETDRYARSGNWGITPWIARWLCKHWQGKLFRLGRLQFSPSTFTGRIRVYRHRRTGEVTTLSEDGVSFLESGWAWGECCGGAARSWTSRFEEGADRILGHPIDREGRASANPVSLSPDEWESVLAGDDAALTFHIPAGEPLDLHACAASFGRACEFFPSILGYTQFKAFWTGSWLLEPLWGRLLDQDSNMVSFRRFLRPYPGVQGGDGQFLERAFGWGTTSLAGLPRTTSLQRAIGEHLEAGGHFHGGFAFLLREDVAEAQGY